jgi:uncharacterized protein DUF4388
VSETTASDAMAMNLSGEGNRDSAVVGTVSSESAATVEDSVAFAEGAFAEGALVEGAFPEGAFAESIDSAVEIEVEEIPLEIPPPAPTGFPAPAGFQAFLQHANLHNLLQIESLSRTTGVFLVASQGRRGYLHLANGELIHADCGSLTGEPAASEILSWGDGEFKSCTRPLVAAPSIHSSLQALLLRLARDSDEAAQSERRPGWVPRPIEEDKPTEPHLPAVGADGQRRASSSPPPRSSRLPPPLPPRIERDPASRDLFNRDAAQRDLKERELNAREGATRDSTNVAEVLISPSGDLVQGRGIGPDEFSARVAYAARLADLIGRAIRSGTPRALELKGKGTHTTVKWQSDGSLAATLELIQSPKIR